jgi:hypothetical protein
MLDGCVVALLEMLNWILAGPAARSTVRSRYEGIPSRLAIRLNRKNAQTGTAGTPVRSENGQT